jgi:hypothetical protein
MFLSLSGFGDPNAQGRALVPVGTPSLDETFGLFSLASRCVWCSVKKSIDKPDAGGGTQSAQIECV